MIETPSTRFGIARFGTARFGTAWFGTAWFGTGRFSTAWFGDHEHLTRLWLRRILLVGGAVTLAGVALARCPIRVQVEGLSMTPGLEPGDRLVIIPTRRIRPGQIIAVADPRQPDRILVKRVAAVRPGEVDVLGDNPAQSTDSRIFGSVPMRSVWGRAVYRYAPAPRAGRLNRSGGSTPSDRRPGVRPNPLR